MSGLGPSPFALNTLLRCTWLSLGEATLAEREAVNVPASSIQYKQFDQHCSSLPSMESPAKGCQGQQKDSY